MILQKQNIRFRGKTLRFLVTFCSCTGFLLLGYDQGLMSTIVGADNRFGKDFNHPDSDVQGLLSSVYDLGCCLGSVMCFFVGERAGRRWMMLTGGSTMIVGTIILASSYTRGQFYVGRIVTGIGNGFNSSTIPVYQAECALAGNRGKMLTYQAVVTIAGVIIAYWVGYGTSFTDSPVQWRFPCSLQGLFALALVIELLTGILPETPRWLVTKKRYSEAQEVLAAIFDEDLDSDIVLQEVQDIKTTVDNEAAGGEFRFGELFEIHNGNLRRLILSCGIMIMQQFTGSNMINYYAPIVYQNTMHLSRNTSLVLGGCCEIVYLVGAFVPVWTIDKYGRRTMLFISSAGLTVCFIAVSGLLSQERYATSVAASCFVFLYQLFMGVGWLNVWFFPAELNGTRLRSRVQAIASFINWLSVFAVVQITPKAINNIGWRTFIIFAILNFTWIPIVFCFYPETKGLELEDIDHLFDRGGFTGGVFTTRGHPIRPGERRKDIESKAFVVDEKDHVSFVE
ncbi:hypothetical protein KL950_000791 [Ogataea haglerorum]|nr:hypothetical protein KL915_001644 [Ogataea haglerorum]KAG7710825.1 hypothetical protein KL950_000791 [Ogataea haglerorum]KAG7755166.1 hypothetical protein KL947_004354 [Ogataea haglerorum]